MNGFEMHRMGVIMSPEPGNENEVEGVLNPAGARGPDGNMYLFPRLVAKGNYSRIGIAKVIYDSKGNPIGVERLGIALEPETDYEKGPNGTGGCEDPRITFVEPMGRYVMTYTALSPVGPRIAVATSIDLFRWKRQGLVRFAPYLGIDFVHVANKDASLFPVAIPNHRGKMQLAIVHRPLFPGTRPEETVKEPRPRVMDLDRESIWISYCPISVKHHDPEELGLFNSHRRLAAPIASWEQLKIGCGPPPILTPLGWLLLYHGVSKRVQEGPVGLLLEYDAGAIILSKQEPCQVLYRTPQPLLKPETPEEQNGTIPYVVFPTAIDPRPDLDLPNQYDVYYGMADTQIGTARLSIPEKLE